MIRFTQENIDSSIAIQSWNRDSIRIQGQEYQHSILLSPDGVRPWAVNHCAQLNADNLSSLLHPAIELVLLGCGQRQHFLPPALLAPFIQRGLGLEVMTSAAACRTWNLLAAEGRRVAAGIILGGQGL